MTARISSKLRGYTIVELMMSLAVLSVGVTGLIAMQKVTVASNLHAKSVAIATRVAQAWQDQLAADATLWNRTNGLVNTTWLQNITSTQTWFRPSYSPTLKFGAAFDALGNPVDETVSLDPTQFCVHVELVPIYPTTGTLGLLRSTVRVFWPRRQGNVGTPNFCSPARDITALGDDIDDFHFLYQVAAVRIQP